MELHFSLPTANANGPGTIDLADVEIFAITIGPGAVTPPTGPGDRGAGRRHDRRAASSGRRRSAPDRCGAGQAPDRASADVRRTDCREAEAGGLRASGRPEAGRRRAETGGRSPPGCRGAEARRRRPRGSRSRRWPARSRRRATKPDPGGARRGGPRRAHRDRDAPTRIYTIRGLSRSGGRVCCRRGSSCRSGRRLRRRRRLRRSCRPRSGRGRLDAAGGRARDAAISFNVYVGDDAARRSIRRRLPTSSSRLAAWSTGRSSASSYAPCRRSRRSRSRACRPRPPA